MTFWEFLLINFDAAWNRAPPPSWRLKRYLSGMNLTEWDIIKPAISPDIWWEEALSEISSYSLAHENLTLAFEENTTRYRIAHLWPVPWKSSTISTADIKPVDLSRLLFYRGIAYITQ
jgi:hypothetical protein